MIELSKQLSDENILGMVFSISVEDTYKSGYVDNINYYALPMNKKATKADLSQIEQYEDVIKNFKPDLIHIWGTEYISTYYAVCAAEKNGLINRTLIDIQGLVSIYARHYYGYIEEGEIRIPTIRNVVYKDSLQRQKNNFIMRGKYEIESIKKAKHVMGRTDWDFACVKQINSKVNYYTCNRTLRNSFYKNEWELAKCEKFSIFVTQCHSPLKGLHLVIEALAILVKEWPEVCLYTTGRDILTSNIKERLLDSRYERYLRKIIKKNHLEENIQFLGNLNEMDICERFCKTHVSVLPSSIENSPNSLGEAMYLGVPVVAADVGGVKNMMTHEREGFVYQADAPYMMAHYISRIFEDDNLALKFSSNGKEHAKITHNKEINYMQQLNIYKKIVNDIR